MVELNRKPCSLVPRPRPPPLDTPLRANCHLLSHPLCEEQPGQPTRGPGRKGASGCTRWEAFWISRITALESALSGQETTMKPTNLRLHSRASRLTSRACGWTHQGPKDLFLFSFPKT